MSNYPAGTDTAGAPWNEADVMDVKQASCAVCGRICVSSDDGCTWKDDRTARHVDADETPNGLFVCSRACSSQAMYEAATAEERAALRLLASWNESTLILQKAFLEFNPYQKQLDIRHASVWERWNNAYDMLKLFKLVEKVGAELTGEDEAPAWYSDAVSAAPARKPVQSVDPADTGRRGAIAARAGHS